MQWCTQPTNRPAHKSKYIKILPNSNSIQSDSSIIIQPKMSDKPATIHGRCFMSWQGVGNAFWDLVECPQCLHPCPKKRNNRYQIDDRIETRSRHDRDTIETQLEKQWFLRECWWFFWLFLVEFLSFYGVALVGEKLWCIDHEIYWLPYWLLIAVFVEKGWTSKVV